MRQRIFTLLIALLITTSSAWAETAFGGVYSTTWELSSDNKTLTIGGTGHMPDFPQDETPWNAHLSAITTVEIKNGVTTIGERSFQFCVNLTDVTLPTSLKTIGNHAFSSCIILEEITLPENLETIGESVFHYCSNLTEIIFPANLETISKQVFNGCTSLTKVTLPANLETIGEEAFYRCEALTEITLPANLKTIGYQAFYRCEALSKITILATTPPTLSASAFAGSTSLTHINVPMGSEAEYKSALSAYADKIVTMLTGEGTTTAPYQIYIAEQLNRVREDIDAHYILMNNIDLTDYLAPGGEGYNQWGTKGWQPIGTNGAQFTGTFNGNNHTISNMKIDREGDDYIGLFGVIGSGAEVKDLGIIDCDVTGNDHTSGLVGWNNGGTIENCYVTGSVYGQDYTGGLAGRNNSGTIENCYVTGSVTGKDNTGGLIGRSNGSIYGSYAAVTVDGRDYTGGLAGRNDRAIENCYVTGSVTGNDYTGGLVGHSSGYIESCYAAGSVKGNDDTGGLVGRNNATIKNCYVTGSVTGNDNTGGLVGYSSSSSSSVIENCYATGSVDGQSNVDGLVGENNGSYILSSYANNSNKAQGNLTAITGSLGESWSTGVWAVTNNSHPHLTNLTKHEITFTGAAIDPITVNHGITAFAPPAPAGYTATFTGHDFDNPITGNVTVTIDLTANQYTITLNGNGGNIGGSSTAGHTVTFDQAVGTLPTPTLTGYTFDGWYTATTSGTKYTDATAYTTPDDMDLYAQWTISKYTVRFDMGYISTIAPADIENVEHGTTITAPAAPTRTGHTFNGWFTDTDTEWTFADDEVTADMTLYAKWTPIMYTITFNSQGGSAVAAINIAHGSPVTAPAAPTRADYTFNGWFTAATDGTKVAFPFAATSALTLYAQWTAITPTPDPTPTPEPTPPPVPVRGVTINRSTLDMILNQTVSLSISFQPVQATNKSVTWSSSDESIATVSPTGVVTAVSKGTATITVTTQSGGHRATCEVTVTSPVSNDGVADNTFKVYPNPTTGPVTITGLTVGTTIKVYAITGALAATYTADAEKMIIDLSSLPAGIYLLNANARTIKVVKK